MLGYEVPLWCHGVFGFGGGGGGGRGSCVRRLETLNLKPSILSGFGAGSAVEASRFRRTALGLRV